MSESRDTTRSVIADAAAGVVALLNFPLTALFMIGGFAGSVADTSPDENRMALIIGLALSADCLCSGICLWMARRNPRRRSLARGVVIVSAIAALPIAWFGFSLSDSLEQLVFVAFPITNAACAVALLAFPLAPASATPQLCARCSYDLTGLNHDSLCPECGTGTSPS